MPTTGSLVLRDAARELGLPWDTASSPYVSDDTTVVQMVALLNASGQDFARDYSWSALQLLGVVSLESGHTGPYDLPGGFNRTQAFTVYDPDTKERGWTPVGPQEWARLREQPAGCVIYRPYRILGLQIELFYPPSEDSNLEFNYQSEWWCAEYGAATPLASELSDSRPTALFDHRMLVTDLKARWLEAKGMDSIAARVDQQKAMSRAMGADGVAQTLDVGGPSRGVHLIDGYNLPLTGWGGR